MIKSIIQFPKCIQIILAKYLLRIEGRFGYLVGYSCPRNFHHYPFLDIYIKRLALRNYLSMDMENNIFSLFSAVGHNYSKL